MLGQYWVRATDVLLFLFDFIRSLQKSLLLFYAQLVSLLSLSASTLPCLLEKFDPVPLLMTLVQCLDVAGSPGYYDIPLLEISLQCLLHLTDRFVCVYTYVASVHGYHHLEGGKTFHLQDQMGGWVLALYGRYLLCVVGACSV